MKRLVLLLWLVLLTAMAFAQVETPTHHYFPHDLQLEVGEVLEDTLFDQLSYDVAGSLLPVSARAGFEVRSSNSVLTLFTNPYLTESVSQSFRVQISGSLEVKYADGSSDSEPIDLGIDYSPEAGESHRHKAIHQHKDALWTQLRITGVLVVDSAGAPITVDPNNEWFYLRHQLQIERRYLPNPNDAATVSGTVFDATSNTLSFRWEPVHWATHYDLEWTYVDDYDFATRGSKPAADLTYSFGSSTRVRLAQTSYRLPVVFERGYVILRVRPLSSAAGMTRTIAGRWSLPDEGTVPLGTSTWRVGADVHESDHKNWQIVTDFAEGARHKELVTYLDGSGRNRQSITALSTTRELMVGETIYDHQGRPAVNILPTPQQDTSISPTELPAISYQRSFNLNPFDQPYHRRNFDLDDPASCGLSLDSLSQTSGAGNYFSPANPDQKDHQAYLPDAQGYPFVQTEYTPDGTGRIRRSGGLGPQFQLSSGHETHYYYSVPSQDELDRIFGNDVGFATHYKKEIAVDGNGQATVAYHDAKGQTIATALAGPKPADLEAIEAHVTQPIVLHLLDEENRRDEETNSLVSNRSVYLSQASEVTFAYRLTPARFEDEPCPLTPGLCYDCVYDLSIWVRDDCGETLWHRSERIGDLEHLRSCESVPFAADTTLTLPSGNYFISKSLTVNEAAVETYVEDYLSDECILEIRARLKDDREDTIDPNLCEATCVPCEYQQEGKKFYRIRSNLFRTTNIAIPQVVLTAQPGGCVAVCPEDKDPCKLAYQRLLADMAPGGQYALYEDSTRIVGGSPLGAVNPANFPLSILNESNDLPIQGVSWRTPHSDYRSADGTPAFIEITAENEAIAVPGSVMTSAEGRFVKPEHLVDVEDFIRYWEPSWAEALVVFHPEYFYYQWCIEQQRSYDYDNQMLEIEYFSEAQSGFPFLTDSDPSNDVTGDPFFRSFPGAVAEMQDSLTFFMRHSGLSRPLNIGEAVTVAHHCNHPRMTIADMEGCLIGKQVYSHASTEDKEWQMYRALYTSRKRQVMDREIERYMRSNGYFSNRVIARPVSWLHFAYREKVKRFPSIKDITAFLPDEDGEDFTDSWRAYLNLHQRSRRNSCGLCPAAVDFELLLNALAQESMLTSEVQLPGPPPLTLSSSLADAFGIPGVTSYEWKPVYVDDYFMEVVIESRGSEVCKINLYKDGGASWEDIAFFSCFEVTRDGFSIKGYTPDHEVIEIKGEAPCLDTSFAQCSDPEPTCRVTSEARELGVFFDYLFQQNFHTASNIRVHTAGWESPHFGPSLRARHPSATRWDWQFRGWISFDREFEAELAILIPDGRVVPSFTERCRFSLRVKTPGATFSDIAGLIDIIPGGDHEDNACEQHGFILIAEREDGTTFEIEGASECYAISNCCTEVGEGACCLPITPRIPWQPTCLKDELDLADSNAERVFRWRLQWLADSVRTAYVDHCLSAAEQLDVTYDEDTYHYTLFYYDQIGNLVKTVPPRGVRLLSAAQMQQVRDYRDGRRPTRRIPNHRQTTTYRHNSLNEIIEKETPDGGAIRSCYDELGRIILSQDAVQAAQATATYVLYDEIGRMTESGKIDAISSPLPSQLRYQLDFLDRWMTGTKTEIVKTYYDRSVSPTVSGYFPEGQGHLRNRIATVSYQEESGERYDHATHYDYDAIGNIQELVQEFAKLGRDYPALGAGGHHIKRVHYDYDLITGNVNQITYQPEEDDQFIHWYHYDADNRLIDVRTGRWAYEDEATIDLDAHYEYYKHGPESRIELGMEKVQGLDFAYTIQGWLKAMNSETLVPTRDMGGDGAAGKHSLMARDVLGQGLHYYHGDYASINSALSAHGHPVADAEGTSLVSHDLFNGFIKHEVSAIGAFIDPIQAKTYRYDQLGRLKQMRIFKDLTDQLIDNNSWASGGFTNDHRTIVNYDANGNIRSLSRRDGEGAYMDRLNYRYAANNNQLQQITDRVTTAYALDLENQSSSSNYTYDEKGRLASDEAESIGDIEWTATDKVRRILKTEDCCPDMDYGHMIEFEYNASGHRVWKDSPAGTTYYVRDNSGNILSTYAIEDDTVHWKYVPIYGSGRLGIYQPDTAIMALDPQGGIRGQKHYELTNHVGSVLTTISDRKLPLDSMTFQSDITSAQDYYPFGMLMPGRQRDTLALSAPPMGFQGMENDHDIKGKGNSQTTEYRQFDPRVGRWLSVDPKAHLFAERNPYNAMFNNPVSVTDPKGDQPPVNPDALLNTPFAQQLLQNQEQEERAERRRVRLRLQIRNHRGALIRSRDASTFRLTIVNEEGEEVVRSVRARVVAGEVQFDLTEDAPVRGRIFIEGTIREGEGSTATTTQVRGSYRIRSRLGRVVEFQVRQSASEDPPDETRTTTTTRRGEETTETDGDPSGSLGARGASIGFQTNDSEVEQRNSGRSDQTTRVRQRRRGDANLVIRRVPRPRRRQPESHAIIRDSETGEVLGEIRNGRRRQ